MSRPIRKGFWLRRRGRVWYRFWYDEGSRTTHRASLKTADEATALARHAAFLAGDAPDVEAPAWRIWALRMCKRARENAKAKGRVFDLSPRFVEELMRGQGYRCAVTGVALEHTFKYRNPFGPSLDQIKPGKGYTETNVRVVAMIVNTAMNGWGEEPLYRLIRESAFGPVYRQKLAELDPDSQTQQPISSIKSAS